MKVKVFKEITVRALEQKMNEFLEQHDVEVVDMQLKVQRTPTYMTNDMVVLMLYKELSPRRI